MKIELETIKGVLELYQKQEVAQVELLAGFAYKGERAVDSPAYKALEALDKLQDEINTNQ